MKTTNLLISGAVAGLLALAGTAAHAEDKAPAKDAAKDAGKEKCYGVAAKGKNDCGTAKHSCAGQAAADNLAEEWKFVAKGTCEKMKGSLKKPEAKADGKGEAPKANYGG